MERTEQEQSALDVLKVLKGHELTDGAVIAGFTVTITDKKTGEKDVIEI